ncbi:hypothetical protein SNK03_013335 [Fusarium graminearum]
MVYTGEPSKACQPCREKRRKCDYAQPGCSQCARQKIPCPGYRSDWELRHRDQTTSLAQESRKSEDKRIAKSSLPSPQSSGTHSATLGSPSRVIDNHLVSSAVSYFLFTYIDATAYGAYLPQLYIEAILQQPVQGALFTAVRATSLAALARQRKSQNIMKVAFKRFSTALSETNASLADPNEAILNTTLGAVLTLGLFESIVSNGCHNIRNWIAHTLGTIALLRLRGVHQFKDLLGRRMCIHAAYNIRVSCINRNVDVPEHLLDLEHEWYQAFSFPKPVRDHYSIMDRVCSVKARLQNGSTPELIHQAINIDKDAKQLIRTFSMSGGGGQHVVSHTSPPNMPMAGMNQKSSLDIDISSLPLVMMARWLFGMSMLRLVMIEVVWNSISKISSQSLIIPKLNVIPLEAFSTGDIRTHINAYANHRIAQIAKMILAFAPRFLDANDPNSRFPRMARCMILPLAFIQSSPCFPSDTRQEVLDLLSVLERDIELSQAEHAGTITHGSRLAGD